MKDSKDGANSSNEKSQGEKLDDEDMEGITQA